MGTRVTHATHAAGVNVPVDFSLFLLKTHATHATHTRNAQDPLGGIKDELEVEHGTPYLLNPFLHEVRA